VFSQVAVDVNIKTLVLAGHKSSGAMGRGCIDAPDLEDCRDRRPEVGTSSAYGSARISLVWSRDLFKARQTGRELPVDALKGLFGGGSNDDDHAAKAQDFISRYQQGANDQGYSHDEALQHFQNVAQNADPATMQRAAEQTFAGMDSNQRTQVSQMLQQQSGMQQSGGASNDPRQMAGMVSQIQQQNPSGLASLFGGGGGGGIGDAISGILGGGNTSGSGSNSGGGGFPGGTIGKVALGGIAAYAMKEMLGGGGGDKSGSNRSV